MIRWSLVRDDLNQGGAPKRQQRKGKWVMKEQKTTRANGFTLIELLVVIA